MKRLICFASVLLFASLVFSITGSINGQYPMQVRVFDAVEGGTKIWNAEFENIMFTDGIPSFNPEAVIRVQDFGLSVVYMEIIVDGSPISSARTRINMRSSLSRELEPMDEMDMGIEIGETGNDAAVRSDRLVIGDGDPNEKVTIEGAMSIQEQDVPPGASAGFGKIFIDNTDNHLYYIDESGNITDLTVDANAIQSVSSSANHIGRMDHMRFIPGTATEITESATDDTIYIRYDVNVTSTGSDPCTSAPSMPASIDGPSLVCSGEPGASYSVPPVSGATYYRWTLPTGSTIVSGSSTNAIHVILGSSDGNISVSAMNDCGESSPRLLAVSINRPTSPGSISGDALVCQGATGIAYSIATVPDATDYNWTLPPGASLSTGSGTPTITVNFGTLGGDVCVRTVNSCGISDPECLPVTTTTTPSIPGSISGDFDVCGGVTGVTYSISPVAEATSYSWTLPSGASIAGGAGTASINVDFGTAGGDICVTASSICGTSSARCQTVTVTNPPATPGAISGATTVVPSASGVSYSISPVTGATSYDWNIVSGDATISGDDSGTSINVNFGSTSGSSVQICVQAINSCGVSSTSCETVLIAAPSSWFTNNTSWTQANSSYCSTYYSSFPPTITLDGNLSNYYLSASGAVTNQWIVYNFGTTRTLTKFRVYNHSSYGGSSGIIPKNCRLQVASSLSGPWSDVHTWVNPATSGSWEETASFSATSSQYWRFYMTDRWGTSGGSYVLVTEVGFYGY